MSLVTWGLGPGGGETKYVMRAYHTIVPIGYVYWTVEGAPDGTGAQAPYPAVDLIDIVVIRSYVPAA